MDENAPAVRLAHFYIMMSYKSKACYVQFLYHRCVYTALCNQLNAKDFGKSLNVPGPKFREMNFLQTYRYGHFSNQYIIHGEKNANFYLP